MEPTAAPEPIVLPPQPVKRPSPFGLATISLLFANIVTIILFYLNHGSIVQVLWIYWLQSLIIGLVAIIRMATVPVTLANATASMNRGANVLRAFVIAFFIFSYGFFHLVYGIFLYAFSVATTIDIDGVAHHLDLGADHLSVIAILIGGVVFATHHLISYVTERREQSQQGILSFGVAFMRPFARILPMHLIIIAGPVVSIYLGNTAVFIVFMILKTVADLRLQLSGTSHPITPATFATVNQTGPTSA